MADGECVTLLQCVEDAHHGIRVRFVSVFTENKSKRERDNGREKEREIDKRWTAGGPLWRKRVVRSSLLACSLLLAGRFVY